MPPMEGVFLSPEYYRELTDKADRMPGLERERDEARAEVVRLGKQVERLEADNRKLLTHGLTEALMPRYVQVRVQMAGEQVLAAEVVPANVRHIPLSRRD